jgi:hypothetical protein
MSHFVAHVLTESKLVRVDADLDQEEVDTAKEITESLVVNNTLCDSVADGHDGDFSAAIELDVGGQNVQLDIFNIIESRVVFVVGVDEVLNFSHSEFTE